MSRNQPPASAFAVVSPSGSLDASALASSSRADPSKTSSHRAYTTVTPGVPGTAMRSSRYSHPPVSGPMFDFARQKIRRSVSASRTLAVAVTTRGSAPNATDPVTRSMGSRPAVLLVKCEIPRTAASSSLANPASGRRALRTSVFLWVSPGTTVTTGSTSTSAHCGISRAATSSAGMSVAGSNCRAPSRSTEPITKWTRRGSPPAAKNLGNSVSAGSSSSDHTSTCPGAHFVPSGHRPPAVTTAANVSAMVLLPVPGAPANICSLPRASQPSHGHLIGSTRRVSPRTRMTRLSQFAPAGLPPPAETHPLPAPSRPL